MLLLLWKSVGSETGKPYGVKWYHDPDFAPRCLVPAEFGISIVNPYMPVGMNECALAILGDQCTAADVYQDQLIFGTASGGLYQMDWPSIKNTPCDVTSPPDISGLIGTFSGFSGLPSQNIKSIEANNGYLSVVTEAGLSFGSESVSSFINYVSSSGTDTYVSADGTVFFAEGNRVLRKANVSDFGSWDNTYQLGSQVNDIWVNEKDGVETLFVATASGLTVFEKGISYHYGTKDYKQVKAEVGADMWKGHIFGVTSTQVDVINMHLKSLENTIDYSGIGFVAIENKRLYSK